MSQHKISLKKIENFIACFKPVTIRDFDDMANIKYSGF